MIQRELMRWGEARRASGVGNRRSAQDAVCHGAADVGEAEVTASVVVGEPGVIEPQEMQYGGMPIMQVHGVQHGFVPQVIGGTVGQSAADAATCHPEAIALVIVISPILTLGIRRAAKLAGPDHQGVLEQTSRFQVGKQCCNRLVRGSAAGAELFLEPIVMIPVHRGCDLDEADSCLGQATGE